MILFDLQELALFVVAGLLLNLTPGPDLLYIAARSVGEGFRAGAISALGVSAGCLVHATTAAFGLSLLLKTQPWSYDVIRLVGAAYLCWLGVTAIRGAGKPASPPAAGGTFVQALLTNLTNPKVALFFLAFLPQFAHPQRGAIELQMLLLGAIFAFNGTWVCLGVAWLASRLRRWRNGSAALARNLQRASGGMLVGLGLALALQRR